MATSGLASECIKKKAVIDRRYRRFHYWPLTREGPPSPAFNPDFTFKICPESRRRAIARFCLSSIGVALPPAFSEILVFMFVPFLHQYRRGLQARLYRSFDFHVCTPFELL
jgi:hypothetical protein